MDISNYFQLVDEAASWLRKRITIVPRIAVVLTAGLEGFIDDIDRPVKVNSSDIPHFPRPSAEGHSGTLVVGTMKGMPTAVLSGRFHYYEGHAPHEAVFPLFVLAAMGADTVIATNAAGGINKSFEPGDLMLVTDHINMTAMNPLVGIAMLRAKDQFTDMTNAYDVGLRELCIRVTKQLGIRLRQGVYIGVSGPSYETKAEIRAFRGLGADAVGMSTVPEVIAANFLGLKVLCLSCIANAAADLHKGAISHGEVLDAMQKLAPRVVRLIQGIIEELGIS